MLDTWENQLQRSADYLRSQFFRSQSVVGWFCSLWAAVRMNWCHDGMEWQDQVPGLMGSKKQRSRPEEGTRAKFTFLRQVHIDLLPPSKFTSQAASPPSCNLFKFNLWWIDPLTMTTQPLLKAVSVATVLTRKQAFNQQLFPVRLGGSYPANYNPIKRWCLLPLETGMPMSCESQVFVYSAKIFVCVIDIDRGSVETFLERYKFLPLRLWQRFVMPLCRICFQLISCQAFWSNYTLTECFKGFPNLRPSHRLSSQTTGWTIQLKVHVYHKQIISQTQA